MVTLQCLTVKSMQCHRAVRTVCQVAHMVTLHVDCCHEAHAVCQVASLLDLIQPYERSRGGVILLDAVAESVKRRLHVRKVGTLDLGQVKPMTYNLYLSLPSLAPGITRIEPAVVS